MTTETPYQRGEQFTHQGAEVVFVDEGRFKCVACDIYEGKTAQAVTMHYNVHCKMNPEHDAIAAARRRGNAAADTPEGAEPIIRSQRGRSRRGTDRIPTVFEQIRSRPGGMSGGPAAYFINPDGATIREALIIYPNGAPVIRNGRDRANSEMYQLRQRRKGYEYVGPTLTREGLRRLIEVITSNKQDYVLDLMEQRAEAEQVIKNSDRPEVRDGQRKRRDQFDRLLAMAKQEINPDALMSEMDDILKAQRLAALTPAQREAISIMFDQEVDARVASLVARMSGKSVKNDVVSASVTNAGADESF